MREGDGESRLPAGLHGGEDDGGKGETRLRNEQQVRTKSKARSRKKEAKKNKKLFSRVF